MILFGGPQGWSWSRFAILAWIIVTLAAAGKLAAAPTKHSVFPIYRAGVDDWLSGRPVYVEREGLDLYRYPPPSLPFFGLMQPLGLRLGSFVYTLCGSAGVFAATEALRRWLLPGATHWSDGRVAAYRFAVLLMAARSLWNAQANTALGALLFGGLACAATRPWAGASFFSLAMLLKPTVLPVVMLAGAARPALAAFTLITTLAWAAALSAPVGGRAIELWEEWARHGRSSMGERRAAFRDAWTAIVSVEAAARGSLPELDKAYPRWWLPASGVAAAAALAACLTRRDLAASGMAGTAWLLLMGPAIEPPTYLLMGPWLGWSVACGARLGMAALALAFASLALPGTPATPWLAWTPALLPLCVACLAAWLAMTPVARPEDETR